MGWGSGIDWVVTMNELREKEGFKKWVKCEHFHLRRGLNRIGEPVDIEVHCQGGAWLTRSLDEHYISGTCSKCKRIIAERV